MPDMLVAGLQYRYSTIFADLLMDLGLTLLVAAGTSGSVLTVWADADGLRVTADPFPQPRALAAFEAQLALGLPGQILGFDWTEQRYGAPGRRNGWWWNYPSRSRVTADSPCIDLAWDKTGLWTLQNQPARITVQASAGDTRVFWTHCDSGSPFAGRDSLFSGMAFLGSVPRFLTAFPAASVSGEAEAASPIPAGVLMDIRQQQALVTDLWSPHSPRVHRRRLWVLNSGRGELAEFDLHARRLRAFCRFPGFARGLACHEDYAFVGLSSHPDPGLLTNSPLADTSTSLCCGIAIIHLPTGRCHGQLEFDAGVQEVLALELLQTSIPRARARVTDHDVPR